MCCDWAAAGEASPVAGRVFPHGVAMGSALYLVAVMSGIHTGPLTQQNGSMLTFQSYLGSTPGFLTRFSHAIVG